MKYAETVKGIFVSRPNRFIARVIIDGIEQTVHVKNTGRCRELLIPGCEVYCSVADNPNRKTKYDLVTVYKKGTGLINIDSQAVNTVAWEWLNNGELFPNGATIKREVTYCSSRFDFYIEYNGKKAFLEAKGVTLERDGVCSFPDAPTERGIKHINELIKCRADGYEAYILFVVQMKGMKYFQPQKEIHPDFAEALARAKQHGVKIIAIDCQIKADEIIADSFVDVRV